MSDSVREQLVQAAVTALDGAGKPTGLTVHRTPTRALTRDALPAMAVYVLHEALPPERQQPARGRQLARRVCTLAIECRVLADLVSGVEQPVDQALDPLLSWAVQALCADPTLGGLAHALSELGTEWRAVEELDATYGAAVVHVQIDYITAAGDPTART